MNPKLNEMFVGVYSNGYIPSRNDYGFNNLKDLTRQLDNGKRSAGQVYAILMGMGVPFDRAKHATENFFEGASKKETLYYYDANDKNKINIMVKKDYNLEDLKARLTSLKEEIKPIAEDEVTKINYSAKRVFEILESSVIRVTVLDESLTALIEEKDPSKRSLLLNRVHEAHIKGNPVFNSIVTSIEEVKNFNDLVPVAEFLGEMYQFLNENKFKYLLTRAYLLLEGDTRNNYYKYALEDIMYLIEKDEEAIRDTLVNVLDKHRWIPSVKTILEAYSTFDRSTNKLASNKDGVVNRVYSPVQINEDKSLIFYLDNGYFKLHENEITIAKKGDLNANFMRLQKVFETFKVNNDKFLTYGRNNVLEIDPNEGTVKLNEKEVDIKDFQSFRNKLIAKSFYSMNDMGQLDELFYFMNSLDNIKEIDFVTSVKSVIAENVKVNLFNIDDKIYIQRINPSMKVNEFVEVESATKAQELMTEYINFDISKSVYDKLEEENKKRLDLEEKKAVIVDEINFISENKIKLEKALKIYGKSEQLQEGVELLKTELKDKEIELQKIYQELGGTLTEAKSLEDRGYIPATISENEGPFKKGDTVYVYAEDYTTKGDKEKVGVIAVKGKKETSGSVIKKHVKISV